MTVVIPPRAWHVTHAQQMLLELITICLNLHVAALFGILILLSLDWIFCASSFVGMARLYQLC